MTAMTAMTEMAKTTESAATIDMAAITETKTPEKHCGESCVSFDDLFRAAQARDMNAIEREDLRRLDQAALNRWVHVQVVRCNDQLWVEDRVGSNGITYAAFGRA